jgi:hypothetical protein
MLNEEKMQLLAYINEEMEALKNNLNASKDIQTEEIANLNKEKKTTIEVCSLLYDFILFSFLTVVEV